MAKKVVVTGANGHVGTALTKDLLEHGYNVLATVRDAEDPSRTDHLREIANSLGAEERLSIRSADLMKHPPWADILSGIDGLFAVAAVFRTKSSDPENEIVRPSTEGGIELLRAAAEAGVPRVVYTSSVAAIGSLPGGRPKTEDDWNQDATLPYTRAKTEAERLAWKVAEETGIDLRVVNPTMVWGPHFARHTPSTHVARSLLKGGFPAAPKSSFAIVDVRDVATVHRLVFEEDSASGRHIVSGEHGKMFEIGRRFKAAVPHSRPPRFQVPWFVVYLWATLDMMKGALGLKSTLNYRIVRSIKGGDSWVDTSKSRGLGWEPISLEKTILDTAEWIEKKGL